MNIQIKQLEGRDHYVVPMVMIVEGVLCGSNGPLLYPANELQQSAHLWNGRPVVVYHPDMFAESFAGAPTVFNRQKIGTVFHTRFIDRRLKAEAWIDVARAQEVDSRVSDAILKRRMLEVSTGLFTDNEANEGAFDGARYRAIARNYRPDHLAILPDKIGACSITHGAGLIRNEVEVLITPLPVCVW